MGVRNIKQLYFDIAQEKQVEYLLFLFSDISIMQPALLTSTWSGKFCSVTSLRWALLIEIAVRLPLRDSCMLLVMVLSAEEHKKPSATGHGKPSPTGYGKPAVVTYRTPVVTGYVKPIPRLRGDGKKTSKSLKKKNRRLLKPSDVYFLFTTYTFDSFLQSFSSGSLRSLAM